MSFFSDIFSRPELNRDPAETEFDIQSEEGSATERLQLEETPGIEISEDDFVGALEHEAEDLPREGKAMTNHAQSRLGAFRAFEDAQLYARDELFRMSQVLSAIESRYAAARGFVDDGEADIMRLNDAELANQQLAGENRRLTERVDKLERLRQRFTAAIELQRTRESRLVEEADQLREELAAIRLESLDTRNQLNVLEGASSDLQLRVSAQAVDTDRLNREVESLREKNVVQALELDRGQQRSADYKRRMEEAQAMQAADSARANEAESRLAVEETEVLRLQKQHDSIESRVHELAETLQANRQELEERDRRHQSEMQGLRLECQQLLGRLQAAQADKADRVKQLNIAEARVGELEAERRLLDQKLAKAALERAGSFSVGLSNEAHLKAVISEQAEQIKSLAEQLQRISSEDEDGAKTRVKRRAASASVAPPTSA